jgi:uncharacterized membrane protein YkvA (DUF1232 family)
LQERINADRQLEKKAKQLKREIHAVYLAMKDPRTPWYAQVLAVVIVGYAFSPIDLIPDPIPILGYLDDLVLLTLGILLLVKIIPSEIFLDCRAKAAAFESSKKTEELDCWFHYHCHLGGSNISDGPLYTAGNSIKMVLYIRAETKSPIPKSATHSLLKFDKDIRFMLELFLQIQHEVYRIGILNRKGGSAVLVARFRN